MCYLCAKDIEFGLPKQPDRRKERAKELKKLIAEIEEEKDSKCAVGEVMYVALREEQYALAREL